MSCIFRIPIRLAALLAGVELRSLDGGKPQAVALAACCPQAFGARRQAASAIVAPGRAKLL